MISVFFSIPIKKMFKERYFNKTIVTVTSFCYPNIQQEIIKFQKYNVLIINNL
jgi:hypothetical protein